MGLFGRGKKDGAAAEKQKEVAAKAAAPPPQQPDPAPAKPEPVAAMPGETSVFEFGSASSSEDRITLAGYCPVSDELEPCRWEILPSGGTEAPKFRIIF